MQKHELGGFLMAFVFAEGPQATSNIYGVRFKSAWRNHPPKTKNHKNFDSLCFSDSWSLYCYDKNSKLCRSPCGSQCLSSNLQYLSFMLFFVYCNMDLIGLNPRKYFFCGTLPAFVRCFFSVNKNPNRCLFHRFFKRDI